MHYLSLVTRLEQVVHDARKLVYSWASVGLCSIPKQAGLSETNPRVWAKRQIRCLWRFVYGIVEVAGTKGRHSGCWRGRRCQLAGACDAHDSIDKSP